MSENEQILLVGAGRMGGAMLRGWLAQGIAPSRIVVEDPHLTPEDVAFLQRSGVGSGLAALHGVPGIVVMAVKPQSMDIVLAAIAPVCGPDTVIVSVAAGRTLASLERHFPAATAVIRAMPNTPASVGRGITGAVCNASVTQSQKDLCDQLLAAVGEVVWLDHEALIDAVTAISGSGPAYVFHFVECLAAAGEKQGLTPEIAARLARATVTGAGELLHQSVDTPARLRENVTSPNGTTAAALAVLMADPGLQDLLIRAAAAAAKRSQELAG